MVNKQTQTQRILDYITEFGSITQFDALKDLGVMRLASRISDLKRQGYPIKSNVEAVKNRYGEKVHIKRYFFFEQPTKCRYNHESSCGYPVDDCPNCPVHPDNYDPHWGVTKAVVL